MATDSNITIDSYTRELLDKIDRLDARLDMLEKNIAVLSSTVTWYEQQVKDLKARFWSTLSISITVILAVTGWALQEILQ
jgi:hypothetical protein